MSQIEPIVTVAVALQDLVEAVQKVGPLLPPRERPAFDATVQRVRRARVALQLWVDENR